MGWAKENLSVSDRAAIAKSLFTVEEEKNGWLNGHCPLHEDENPSFGYHPENDVFHCLAGCSKDGDLIELYCRVNGLDNKAGFLDFKEKFGNQAVTPAPKQKPAKTEKKATKKPSVRNELALKNIESDFALFPPLPEAWLARLAEARKWTKEAVQRLDLRVQTHYRAKETGELRKVRKGNERIAIPIYQGGKLKNIRLYRPGAEKFKIISWVSGSGGARLFPDPAHLDDSGPIILAEGEPDTICAISHGFCAVTQTSKTIKWKKGQLKPFVGRDVIIAYDADQPGLRYAEAAALALAKVAASVRIINWPDCMLDENMGLPKKHGQDLTDFFVRHGHTEADFRRLWESATIIDTEYSEKRSIASGFEFFEAGATGRISFKPRLLAEKIMEDISLMTDPVSGLTYKWNGTHWELYDVAHIKNKAIEYLGIEAKKSRVEDSVYQVQVMGAIPHGRKINDKHDFICLENGMFNLKNFEVYPHAKDYFSTIKIGVKFDPDNIPSCERWEQFLEETIQTEGPIRQMQEFFGYCLTRETRYQKCLLNLGPGADGKSLVSKVLRALCGPENCSSVSFNELQDQFYRASLYNMQVNISTEIGNQAMESEFFKAIVTGDPISAAFKNVDPFTFVPFCKLVFATNKLPKVLDNTDGFYRRLLPIKFKQQFLGDNDDKYLEDKLMAELDGIFAWSLIGLMRLQEQDGFTECEETEELLGGYKRLNNPVYAFAEDCLVVGDYEYGETKEGLYKAYRKYCSENGYRTSHRENFFRELKAIIPAMKQYRPRIQNKRVCCVKGVALKDDLSINS